jgi:ribosome production factor 1
VTLIRETSAAPEEGLERMSESRHSKPTSEIRNKVKRFEVHGKRTIEKRKAAEERRLQRKRELHELGKPLPEPKTIESKRIKTEDVVDPEDAEIKGEDEVDEFAPFWNNEKEPKILLTTRPRPSKHLFRFVGDLMTMVPFMFYHPRKSRELKEMARWAVDNEFTHMIVLGERNKECSRLTLSLLPDGPTAQFKVSSVQLMKEIYNHGAPTDHLPELVLNNFSTRLGHRLGRFLGTLFPRKPEFDGRTAVTFHNQRDFIFVRQHRYEFVNGFKRANLQEIGPRFTLKLRWMSTGGDSVSDRKHAEFEFTRDKGEKKFKDATKDGREFFL